LKIEHGSDALKTRQLDSIVASRVPTDLAVRLQGFARAQRTLFL